MGSQAWGNLRKKYCNLDRSWTASSYRSTCLFVARGFFDVDIVDVVYICLSYLWCQVTTNLNDTPWKLKLTTLFVVQPALPRIPGRQCVVLRLLHGSLGCMWHHWSWWRFCKKKFFPSMGWLFWQKPHEVLKLYMFFKFPTELCHYVLVCRGFTGYSTNTQQSEAWVMMIQSCLFFMAFPPSSADRSIPKAATPIKSAFGSWCMWCKVGPY